jgi:hypothetical protein
LTQKDLNDAKLDSLALECVDDFGNRLEPLLQVIEIVHEMAPCNSGG